MGFWESWWSNVTATLTVVLVTAIAGVAVTWARSRLRKRPDFVLTRSVHGYWNLKRTRRGTAHGTYYSATDENGKPVNGGAPGGFSGPGDIGKGQQEPVGGLAGLKAGTFSVSWIYKRRCDSIPVELKEDVDRYEIHAQPMPRRRIRIG